MSIIYDALKKVENKIADTDGGKIDEPKLPKKPPFKLKIYILYILVLSGGFIAAAVVFMLSHPQSHPLVAITKQTNNYLSQLTKSLPKSALPLSVPAKESQQPAPSVPLVSPSDGAKGPVGTPHILVLNGVFFSDNEGYALINNQILREGDVINGMTVEHIALDGVELKSEGSIIKLTTVK